MPQASASIWQMTSGDVPAAAIAWHLGSSAVAVLLKTFHLVIQGFGFPFGIVLAIFSEMTLLTPLAVTG